jgi:hypothetical protein
MNQRRGKTCPASRGIDLSQRDIVAPQQQPTGTQLSFKPTRNGVIDCLLDGRWDLHLS